MTGTWVEQRHEVLGVQSVILPGEMEEISLICLTKGPRFILLPGKVMQDSEEEFLLGQPPHRKSSELSFDPLVGRELP